MKRTMYRCARQVEDRQCKRSGLYGFDESGDDFKAGWRLCGIHFNAELARRERESDADVELRERRDRDGEGCDWQRATWLPACNREVVDYKMGFKYLCEIHLSAQLIRLGHMWDGEPGRCGLCGDPASGTGYEVAGIDDAIGLCAFHIESEAREARELREWRAAREAI